MPSHGADRHAQPAVCNSAAVVSGGTRPAGSGGEALPAGCKPRQPCGTPAAARRHHTHHEPLDDACREALRRYNREYRRDARRLAAFRRREAEASLRWQQRTNADPALRAARRARRRAAARARAAAARNYTDPVVVERLVHGERTPASHAERLAAFRQLLDRGLSPSAAGDRIGINGVYVRKYAEAVA